MTPMPVSDAPHEHAAMHAGATAEDLRAAIAALRMLGQRVTAPRRAVLGALASRPDHLTAEEVTDILEGGDVHRATVYRTLELLTETGIVSRAPSPGGAMRYHLAAPGAGRAHLHGHCVHCGQVVVLPLEVFQSVERTVEAATGFGLALEQSTLAGRCGSCAHAAEQAR
ncbi:transcriptional repressor [Salinibacterium sp. dk2585]|uniref:Fur family transcriptional regulator n=1 Tax=unclassified Salinibacterium TaxID=2632331 RepID=UPI0011C25302|nr:MULTISPECIES: Fur family transcriptional regulator [unclassified Salinibacterium]QEE60561.1 transcriptional repressor [Salinibacterium sp. dk2585]TXK55633.1 transcriptional repressor [Salinibacterium sp. dk5596]